jgi:hypothetical protein
MQARVKIVSGTPDCLAAIEDSMQRVMGGVSVSRGKLLVVNRGSAQVTNNGLGDMMADSALSEEDMERMMRGDKINKEEADAFKSAMTLSRPPEPDSSEIVNPMPMSSAFSEEWMMAQIGEASGSEPPALARPDGASDDILTPSPSNPRALARLKAAIGDPHSYPSS